MKSMFKKSSLSLALAASASFVCGGAVADTNAEIEKLKKRIDQLENAASKAPSTSVSDINIDISGVVEVEAAYVRNDGYAGKSSSDIVLATAQLAFEADIAEGVDVHVSLLHEEDDTDLEVDEAHISYEKDMWFATAGQIYVPFGNFASNLVSDPLTLELGETRESTVEFGINTGPVVASVYVFNGDIDDNGGVDRNKAEMYGLSFAFAGGDDTFSYELGADYISSIADTDTLQDTIATVDDYVAGVSLDASVLVGAINVNVEYTMARDEFELAELAFDGDGAEPSAFNLEVGFLVEVMGYETQLAASYQGTEESLALELPEKRMAVAASTLVADNTSLSVEVSRDSDYSSSDGGTGRNSHAATIQLAVSF